MVDHSVKYTCFVITWLKTAKLLVILLVRASCLLMKIMKIEHKATHYFSLFKHSVQHFRIKIVCEAVCKVDSPGMKSEENPQIDKTYNMNYKFEWDWCFGTIFAFFPCPSCENKLTGQGGAAFL